MKKATKNEYEFIWSNFQYLAIVEMNVSLYTRNKRPWLHINNIIYYVKDNNIKCFHNVEDIEKDVVRGRNFLKSNYVSGFLNEVEHNYQATWKFFRKLKHINLHLLTDKELLSLVEEGKKNWMDHMSMFSAIQAASTSVLAEEIKKYFSKNDYSIVLHKSDSDIIDQEEADWKKMIRKKISKGALLKHADKYPWIVASHLDMKQVMDTLYHRANLSRQKNCLTKSFEKISKKEQAKIIAKAPEKIRNYVRYFHQLSAARIRIKSCWAGLDYYFLPIMEEISFRSGEDVKDINKYYLFGDMANLLRGIKLTQKEKINRKKCLTVLWKNKKLTILSGNRGQELARKELGGLIKGKRERKISGTIANKGRCEGKVRILMSNNFENNKRLRGSFKTGEILVTQMTQPNIIDIAKKAGAIITDEGGMLSHAAIISREFGIPCIVGTHRATDILKDGDLVEVDAEKGIVKIIKRKK